MNFESENSLGIPDSEYDKYAPKTERDLDNILQIKDLSKRLKKYTEDSLEEGTKAENQVKSGDLAFKNFLEEALAEAHIKEDYKKYPAWHFTQGSTPPKSAAGTGSLDLPNDLIRISYIKFLIINYPFLVKEFVEEEEE